MTAQDQQDEHDKPPTNSLAGARRRRGRILGAVAGALLSMLTTFAVVFGVTFISPTREHDKLLTNPLAGAWRRRGGIRGATAVAGALLSALTTVTVLLGMTVIYPTREAVLMFLAANVVTWLLFRARRRVRQRGRPRGRRYRLGLEVAVVATAFVPVVTVIAAAAKVATFGLPEPHCGPVADVSDRDAVEALQSGRDHPGAGCIARVRIGGIDEFFNAAPMPDGSTLVAAGMRNGSDTVVLAGVSLVTGKEAWRTSLGGLRYRRPLRLAISPSGSKAALWGDGSQITIVDLPDGTAVATVPDKGDITADVVFSDESTVVAGMSNERLVVSLSDPGAKPETAPGFGRSDCHGGGLVGESNVVLFFDGWHVRSRDNTMIARGIDRPGRSNNAVRFEDSAVTCGTERTAVFVPPEGWETSFASFSPRSDRLAIVHRRDVWATLPGFGLLVGGEQDQTLIEVWDTDNKAGAFDEHYRLATFLLPGPVYNTISWSQDGHRLVAVRPGRAGDLAFVYAIP